jgi:endonuclease/exonuclease/phosphatase family metal-dependent hydrolase
MSKKSSIRIFGKRAILLLNILISFILLYPLLFSPVEYIWVNGFIGLATPYLLILELFFLFFWLIVKPIMIIPSALSVALSWKLVMVIIGIHPGLSFPKNKKENNVRIISWNVRGFNGLANKSTLKLRTEEIAYSIQKWNPDIICMQEYNTNERKGDIANHATYFEKKYPYSFFSKDYQAKDAAYYSGCIIYSKYKILDSERYPYSNKESLIAATIVKGDDTLQVFTTHLASYRFVQDDFEAIDDATKNKWAVIEKMKQAFQLRAGQATMVEQQINASKYPAIITGDFNDVPSSYTYRKITAGWKDAFLEKGFGLGVTYMGLSPTLRIDYILTNAAWEVKAFEQVDENLSDHHMIMADLLLKKQ